MDRKELRGVRGWLAFFVLALCALGPALELVQQVGDFASARQNMAGTALASRWASYETVAWVVFAVTVLLRWAAGFMLLRVFRRVSVRVAVAVLFATPLLSQLGNLGAIAAAFGDSAARAAGGEVVAGLLRGLLIAAVWTAYLMRSRRVGNTYPGASGM